MNHKVRSAARRAKLFRDQLVDNQILMEESQDDFNMILSLIFDNARPGDDRPFEKSDCQKNQKEVDSQSNTPKENQETKEQSDQSDSNDAEMIESSSRGMSRQIKKLYREIVKMTHPDRYETLGIVSDYQIKRAEKIFQSGKSYAQRECVDGIIEVCAQLEIDLNHIDDIDVEQSLRNSEKNNAEQIKQQEKTLQMLWYAHKEDIKVKIEIIKAYINYMGKTDTKITDALIKDVLLSYNKNGKRKRRKTGERPARLRR